MESRTSSGLPAGSAAEDQLSERLALVVASARRRAARDGDRQIDTAHLLHSLLESDPEVWALLDGGSPQVGKLLGYLVQRSIGYGLRWRSAVEDSGAVPVVPDRAAGMPGWSPAASAALDLALARAAGRGDATATGVDLFAGLVADAECRCVEVLRRAGVDVDAVSARLGAAGTGAGGEETGETRPV